MAANVIESYLISLGFSPDEPGLAKFKGYLGEAGSAVNFHTSGIVKSMLEWQAAITGAFTAVGLGVIGMADHVANADQSYRLLGLQMFMTQDRARTMKIATDALGESMEAIAWDPELHRRYQELIGDQERMGKALGMGDSYEKQLEGIRDIRFEFTRLQVAAEYLSMGFVSQLFTQMGAGPGTLLEKLQQLNNWIQTSLPSLSKEMASYLLPVLQDWKQIMVDTGGALKETAVAFTNLVGIIAGDDSLKGAGFSFANIAHAVADVSHELAKAVEAVILAERAMLHFGEAGAASLRGVWDAAHGRFDESKKDFALAGNEFGQFFKDVTPGSGTVLGGLAGSIGGAAAVGAAGGAAFGPLGALIGGGGGAIVGGLSGMLDGNLFGRAAGAANKHFQVGPETGLDNGGTGSYPSFPTGKIAQMITDTATRYHIDPALAHAIALVESGERQYDSKGNILMSGKGDNGGAKGIFQLEDVAAHDQGVNSLDPQQNIEGGLGYFAGLMDKYKDTTKALEAYNWGEGNLNRALQSGTRVPQDVQQYASGIEAKARDLHFNVVIQGTHLNQQQLTQAMTDTAGQLMDKASQNDLSEMAGVYH